MADIETLMAALLSAASKGLRAVVTPVAVLELVQSRLADPDAAPAVLRLAVRRLNGGLALGGAASTWDGDSYGMVCARLKFDGQAMMDGPANLACGSTFECLLDLVGMVGAIAADFGRGISPSLVR